jgi:transcriptional regulator with XRE-family HTH domain
MPLRADRLRDAREKKGLTQRDLAHLCGITEFQISRYENEKSDTTATSLELMARHLDVSADYLLGLSDYPHGQFGEDLSPDHSRLLDAYTSGDGPTMLEIVSERLRQISKTTDTEKTTNSP